MQAPPGVGSKDTGVDLQMEVSVWVPGSGGVVPDHRGLDLLDQHLHLPAPRPDASGGVLADPSDDLLRGLVLGGVQCGRGLGMQCGGQRPGLRSVDRDLDEPESVRIVAKSALRLPGCHVDPRDPLLVGIAGELAGALDAVGGGRQAGGDAASFAEVVVVSPVLAGLA